MLVRIFGTGLTGLLRSVSHERTTDVSFRIIACTLKVLELRWVTSTLQLNSRAWGAQQARLPSAVLELFSAAQCDCRSAYTLLLIAATSAAAAAAAATH